eukprot:scaffold86752_cov48-Attheya_sp.AAC.1
MAPGMWMVEQVILCHGWVCGDARAKRHALPVPQATIAQKDTTDEPRGMNRKDCSLLFCEQTIGSEGRTMRAYNGHYCADYVAVKVSDNIQKALPVPLSLSLRRSATP